MRHRLQCASVRLELSRYELKLEISELKIVETKKKERNQSIHSYSEPSLAS